MTAFTKQDLEKLIFEEIENMAHSPSSQVLKEEEQEENDPTQQYVDWVVAIQEYAREALQEIENGVEPYKAAHRVVSLARGITDEDFYHHFHG